MSRSLFSLIHAGKKPLAAIWAALVFIQAPSIGVTAQIAPSTFTQVPVLQLTVVNNNAFVTWMTQAGTTYVLETSTNATGPWIALGQPVVGNSGQVVQAVALTAAPQSYFRCRLDTGSQWGYSLNVVGYVKVPLEVGVPIVITRPDLSIPNGNGIGALFPSAPDGAFIAKDDASQSASYDAASSTWLDDVTGTPSSMTISIGERFWFENDLDPSFTMLVFFGEVPQTPGNRPVIGGQPSSLTNITGTTASFSVSATGTAPLLYQWRFNGTNLSDGARVIGAQTPTLSISNVRSIDAGSYTVIITNGYGAVTSAVAGLTILSCAPPPAGLVSWWPMQGNARDIVGTNQPSATNAINFVPGEVGQGVAIGGGGYIDIPDSPSLDNQTFTFAAWVRPDGAGPNTDWVGNAVISKWLADGATGEGLFWESSGTHFVFVPGSQANAITSAHPFGAGNFYHVVGTYDGSVCKLYVNGALEGQRVLSQTLAYSASMPWTIGANPPIFRGPKYGFPRTWNGVIDEVCVFNRALASDEISALYAAGGAGMFGQLLITDQPQAQVGYWGQNAVFSVGATTIAPPLTYQWLKTNAPIVGATNQTILLTNLQAFDAGDYSVLVSDQVGNTVPSQTANLTVNPAGTTVALYAGVTISGVAGFTYGIQSSSNLACTNCWAGRTNLTLTSSNTIWYDPVPASQSSKFYRVVPGPIAVP